MSEETEPYDLIGVGIDAFGASLAALAEPAPDLRVLFLERQPRFQWGPGVRLDSGHPCISMLADLVTLADPTSRWSFLAYLHTRERLYPFLSLRRFHISRMEYDHYCRWVVRSLPACAFGQSVRSIHWSEEDGLFHVEHTDPDGRSAVRRAVNVVLGTGGGLPKHGPECILPHCADAVAGDVSDPFHASVTDRCLPLSRPDFLDPMVPFIEWDDLGRFRVDSTLRAALAPWIRGSLFVHTAALHLDGSGRPDLGQAARGGATIINTLLGREHYDMPGPGAPVPVTTAFPQELGGDRGRRPAAVVD
ncbi:SidA/IucD/PvdA family monooxygenase [Streptomyces sp. L2]|uniref:SidA/IucD/PvdA family monooxygenase n=1 Tax=Streptomyces sp. L2 TaxID=2162665 RepID=UPI0013E8F6F7|nr:SidA/IucD/PvdA family monooxygenase [Streptomyces sp. L2]